MNENLEQTLDFILGDVLRHNHPDITDTINVLSGQNSTLSGQVNILSGQINTISGQVSTLSSDLLLLSGNINPGDNIVIDYSPTNYTVSTNNLSGHLAGIDTELALISGGISGGIFTAGDTVRIDYNPIHYNPITGDISGHFAGISNVIGELCAFHVRSENDDIDIGTETIDFFPASSYDVCFWHAKVKRNGDVRASRLQASWNSSGEISLNEVFADVGNTSGMDLSAVLSSGFVVLLGTVTSDNWSAEVTRHAM